jgi:hypothetical protein
MKDQELPDARPHTLDTSVSNADTAAAPIPLVATGHATRTLDVLRAGQLVCGAYRLDSKLGEGGMGVVWAATQAKTGALAALKFLTLRKRRGVACSAKRAWAWRSRIPASSRFTMS